MTLSRPTSFATLAGAGSFALRLQAIIGKEGEWEDIVDDLMHLWAYLNRRTWVCWGWATGQEETSTSYVVQYERTATPSDERTTNTNSTCEYWVDHAGGDTKIEIYDDTAATLLGSATITDTTRDQASGTIALSSALADDIIVRVSTKWDGVTGTEHTLYGVRVRESAMALADM